jgi:hypothetical protein
LLTSLQRVPRVDAHGHIAGHAEPLDDSPLTINEWGSPRGRPAERAVDPHDPMVKLKIAFGSNRFTDGFANRDSCGKVRTTRKFAWRNADTGVAGVERDTIHAHAAVRRVIIGVVEDATAGVASHALEDDQWTVIGCDDCCPVNAWMSNGVRFDVGAARFKRLACRKGRMTRAAYAPGLGGQCVSAHKGEQWSMEGLCNGDIGVAVLDRSSARATSYCPSRLPAPAHREHFAVV